MKFSMTGQEKCDLLLIIPFLKGEIRRRKSRLCKNLLNTVVTNKTHPGRKGPAILNINTNGIIRLEAGAFKFLRNRLFMTSMQLPRKRDVPSSAILKMSHSLPRHRETVYSYFIMFRPFVRSTVLLYDF
jgi:hypothetical protein